MNNFSTDLIYEKYGYLTNIIPKENNKYYKQIYKDIENDFYKAKELSSDITITIKKYKTIFIKNLNSS